MKLFLVISSFLAYQFVIGQVVFLEFFDEATNATTGTDNIGGVIWNTSVPGGVDANDYFKVVGGKLEAKDTNEPAAAWETGEIDITPCVGLAISVDIRERGNLEDCGDCLTDGFGCIDWLKLEYNLDGLGWTDVSVMSCPATMTYAPGDMIQIGNIPGGAPLAYTSPCIDFGSTLKLRISVSTWAASEFWEVDNVTVFCNDCVLPIEINEFKANTVENGTRISWTTNSERNSNYFEIQRSLDGKFFKSVGYVKGANNSSNATSYNFIDPSPKTSNIVYYRLKMVNFDETFTFSDIISYQYKSPLLLRYSNGYLNFSFNSKNKQEQYSVIIYDLSGKQVDRFYLSGNEMIPWNKNGFFIVEIPNLNVKEKIATF